MLYQELHNVDNKIQPEHPLRPIPGKHGVEQPGTPSAMTPRREPSPPRRDASHLGVAQPGRAPKTPSAPPHLASGPGCSREGYRLGSGWTQVRILPPRSGLDERRPRVILVRYPPEPPSTTPDPYRDVAQLEEHHPLMHHHTWPPGLAERVEGYRLHREGCGFESRRLCCFDSTPTRASLPLRPRHT